MKRKIKILEEINAEIIESIALLEFIYSNTNENHQTDCAIACLIRSLYRTSEKMESNVEILSKEK